MNTEEKYHFHLWCDHDEFMEIYEMLPSHSSDRTVQHLIPIFKDIKIRGKKHRFVYRCIAVSEKAQETAHAMHFLARLFPRAKYAISNTENDRIGFFCSWPTYTVEDLEYNGVWSLFDSYTSKMRYTLQEFKQYFIQDSLYHLEQLLHIPGFKVCHEVMTRLASLLNKDDAMTFDSLEALLKEGMDIAKKAHYEAKDYAIARDTNTVLILYTCLHTIVSECNG